MSETRPDSIAVRRRHYAARLHPEVVNDFARYYIDGLIDDNVLALLAEVLGPGDWRYDAACRGADPELFFPKRGDNTEVARAICADCPVKDECFTYANEAPEVQGIWAGWSTGHRRRQKTARTATGRTGRSRFAGPARACIYCLTDLTANERSVCKACNRRSKSEPVQST